MTTLEQNLAITIGCLVVFIIFLFWIISLLINADHEKCSLCAKKIKKKCLMNVKGKTTSNDKLRTMSFHKKCIVEMIRADSTKLIDHSDKIGELQLGDYKLYILHNKIKEVILNEE
ncbi:hypothetical protein [Spiroplasma sp. DGKH1]|uniref:hypothetical protein n=1 Tax=Spiroplasma sp. DGKH1 TaxID=3050074 RepID=UPI0034C63F12